MIEIINNTVSDVELSVLGVTIPASGSYTVNAQEYLIFISEDSKIEIDNLIGLSTISIRNDGVILTDNEGSRVRDLGSISDISKIRLNDLDSTPKYLDEKIIAGTGTTITQVGDQLEISSTGISNPLIGSMIHMNFIQDGTTKNKWMKAEDKHIEGTKTMNVAPWNMKLVGLSFSNERKSVETDIEIFKYTNGLVETFLYNWEIRDTRSATKTDLPNININAGDKLAIFTADKGTDGKRVLVKLYWQITDDTEQELTETYSGNL